MNTLFGHSSRTQHYPHVYTEVVHGFTDTIRYSVQRHVTSGKHCYSATLKVLAGIRHRTGWTGRDEPTFVDILSECKRGGTFSVRPFRLGQAHDPSVVPCVLALFHHYCHSSGQDPTRLMIRAYPRETASDWTSELWGDIRERATWEQTFFPITWYRNDTQRLLEALRLMGRPFLALMLEENSNLRTTPPPTQTPEPNYSLNPFC